MRGKEGDFYRRSIGHWVRGMGLNFDASAERLFSADGICTSEDVLLRLVKTVDFEGNRRIYTPRATLPSKI